MTTSIRIGTESLSRGYKEGYLINVYTNERRKKQAELTREMIHANRVDQMEANRIAHREDVYSMQGGTSYLVRA